MKPTFTHRSAQRRARGMTLIEIMCAIVIMTIGLLGMMSLMARASQATASSDDAQRAAVLANEIATQMWLAGTITLPTGTVTAWNARVADPVNMGLPNGTGTITAANNVARITIVWTTPGGDQRRYYTDVRLTN
ncbi:prepilin-type N-terminal cleavage/methylation domain-containing protein [Mitsuaria sp. CC2]|jgi:type IV pilus assembly protein PilV|uniref:type IV pilus modification PilV family protein n=1 Tax=Mitsuaria sp. CC2 TaxID=3029186 RepID=UPI003B8DE891